MANPQQTIERLAYSPTEVALALGCTRQHVHNMISRGDLPVSRFGRRLLISAKTLDEIVNGVPRGD